jgi:hypothetical protein
MLTSKHSSLTSQPSWRLCVTPPAAHSLAPTPLNEEDGGFPLRGGSGRLFAEILYLTQSLVYLLGRREELGASRA